MLNDLLLLLLLQSFYPLNYLISSGASRGAPGPDPEATTAPSLRLLSRSPRPQEEGGGDDNNGGGSGAAAAAAVDRLQLELDVVKAAWGVINITGRGGARVLRWSLSGKVAETELPAGVSEK